MNVNDPDVKGASTPGSTTEGATAADAASRPAANADTRSQPAFGAAPAGVVPAPRAGGSRGGRALGWIALLLAIAALAASIYAWQRSERVVREAARRWQDAEARIARLDQQFKLVQDQSRELIGRSAVQENKLGEMGEQQAQLERLYKNFAADTLDSVLADTEVAVSVASQQLQVAGNVQAALAALQDAENNLKRADPQAVATVQRLLARDIDRLRAVPQVDISALSLRLDGIMSSLAQLPMLADATPPGRPDESQPVAAAADGGSTLDRLADSGRRGWNALKNELLQLIRVNRVDDPQAVLLAPEQQYFVRENLRLSLLSARLALLARNEAVLQGDLSHAIDWLNRFYDGQNKAVASALESLKQIQQSPITADLPSLADTLTAVRAQRAAREATR
ncbi:MAG: uroporphyrinogen-III C-methyltransferase [Burkholderiaceae bacterium]